MDSDKVYIQTIGFFRQILPGVQEKEIAEMRRKCDKFYLEHRREDKEWKKMMIKGVIRKGDIILLHRASHLSTGIDVVCHRLGRLLEKGAIIKVEDEDWTIDAHSFQFHLNILRKDQKKTNAAINRYTDRETNTSKGGVRMSKARADRIRSVKKMWMEGISISKMADILNVSRPTIDKDLRFAKIVKSEWAIDRDTRKRVKRKDIKLK